jgi:hypothetical protein
MKRSGFRLLGVAVMVSMAAAFAVSQDAAQTAPKPGKAGDYSRADFDLNLKKEGDVYAGQISDQAGIIPTMDIKNPAYKDGLLTFEIDFPNDTGTSRIAIELKLEGETLKGRWLDPDGNSNVIELTRKK